MTHRPRCLRSPLRCCLRVRPCSFRAAGEQNPPAAALRPAGLAGPPRPRCSRPGAAPGPGQGRGRGFEAIQEYPADPNEVIQALQRLQGRDRREGRPPDAGLVDQHHRGRSGPPHPRRQRAAAVHPADARQGGQGHQDGDDLHAGVRSDGRHLARQRALRPGRPAREALHADHGQSRLRAPERTGRSAPPARSEGRRQLHGGGHAAHLGRWRRRPQRSRHPRGARVARRQALLHHQRQRRRSARRHVSPNSPLRNYADDRIIPLLGAQTGRLGHEKAPGGFIARTTFEGKDYHLFAGGMRNALHFDWNADGEIFSFDSDMEPEFGVPWYRPGPRVLDAERRRPRLSRQQRQVPDLVRGFAAAAGGDRTRQPGGRDLRLHARRFPRSIRRRSTSPTTTTAASSRCI